MTTVPDAPTWRSWDIDPAWSRTITVDGHDGRCHTWHLLDTGEPTGTDGAVATILCVHGNPTWGYAWATFLRRFAGRHRVVAVDQLGMGFSERTATRRYADRVRDLADLIDALDLDPGRPLVLAAHDWGGAVAMGWAIGHAHHLTGLVLCNTGIAVPEGRRAPWLIRLAASRPLRDLVCRRTPLFVEGTLRLAGRRISRRDRRALRAPYRRRIDREAIADFVGDVPLRSPHPSDADLAAVAARLPALHVPTLLAWGGRDPVFDVDFARDLAERLPGAVSHRFARANHLVMAEADVAGLVDTWLDDLLDGRSPGTGSRSSVSSPSGSRAEPRAGGDDEADEAVPLWGALARRCDDDTVAIHDASCGDTLTFRGLAVRVEAAASDLARRGLRPGDRVAMLTPPGVDLIVAVYAVWRAGGVTVIADRGLGPAGLRRAIRTADPRWVVGPRRARLASGALRWAPHATGIDVGDLLDASPPAGGSALAQIDPGDPAAVLFTSGSTGPAKGVRYSHLRLQRQRDALAATYSIGPDDRLVAAFAPFALYGPALGIPTALPDCDVTKPATLTASALDDACRAVDATMVFASPAALSNVVRTAAEGGHRALEAVRGVMSAGAPVPVETLRSVRALVPDARLHTPYGMTEALPIADIDLSGLDAVESAPDGGVCVGRPVPGAEVLVAELGFDAQRGVPESSDAGATGEILVRAPWVSDGYADLWQTERRARPGGGWHRTGDVGHLDGDGRLWVEGRAVHVIDTVAGPITPVPVERAVERLGLDGVTPGRVAAIGVGPTPIQQVVIVLEGVTGPGLASPETTERVRAAVCVPVAAVLHIDELPVDIRHNAKIDRAAVAAWASELLTGGRTSRRFPVRR